MKLLTEYFALQKQIHKYFGYVEDWVVIPLDDATDYYWHLTDDEVSFAEAPITEVMMEELSENGVYLYCNIIYTQRFLPKWVYRGEEYTMICVDTRADGNKFLQVFSNNKECKTL